MTNANTDRNKAQATSVEDLFRQAVQVVNRELGPDYARKNPDLVSKVIDLIIAERASSLFKSLT